MTRVLVLALVLVTGCGDNIDALPDADVGADADESLRCEDVGCGSPIYCNDANEDCACFTGDPTDGWAIVYCTSLCSECDSGDLRCNPATGRCWCVALDGDVDACTP